MRMFRPATTPRMAALAVPVFVILVFGGVIHAQQPVLTTVSAAAPVPAPPAPSGNLNESFGQAKQGGVRVVFLSPQEQQQQQQ